MITPVEVMLLLLAVLLLLEPAERGGRWLRDRTWSPSRRQLSALGRLYDQDRVV